jgi:hypothetical protein
MPHPFIPIPNTASVELIFQYRADVCEITFSVMSNAPFDLTGLQALRTAFNNWDAAQWYLSRVSAITLQRIRTRALDSASSPMEDYHLPTPRPGNVSDAGLPSNVTFAIKLATALAGRSYRGRIYIPAICTLCVSGNQVTAGAQAAWLSELAALQPALTAANANWHLCVASRYNNGAWRTTGVCTQATGWVAVNADLDSQRRRLPGRGHP